MISLSLMQLIMKYFPGLSTEQQRQFSLLPGLYATWNERINLISRRDIINLEERHILHSLSIAMFIRFKTGTTIIDAGTGGGFPGIPLAIMFPQVSFDLVDSTGKKIMVVQEVSKALKLHNVRAIHGRAEEQRGMYHFAVSRAVAPLPLMIRWLKNKIAGTGINSLPNGLLYLKGGEVDDELKSTGLPWVDYDLSTYLEEDFFFTKKLIHIPLGQKK